jgi:protein-L-isoaspartate(D-aspartate) O-methyltransferase
VLRHHFLPGVPWETVYTNRAISAKQDEKGRWLSSSSQPEIMAIMLEQLGLEPGHRVLEIGTGTSYNAALMAHIVGKTGRVVTVDIDQDLVEGARENLRTAGFEQVEVVCADGGYGYPEAAPFDRIILTVGAPDVAPAWWDQLKRDGRLVLPLLLRGSMKSVAFERVNEHLASLSVNDCGFIPLRGDFASKLAERIQLGPDSGLFIEPLDEAPLDAGAVPALLVETTREWPAGVDVNVWDVLGGSLWTWLALHERHMCKLFAEGDRAGNSGVPAVIAIDAKQQSAGTAILLEKTGLAALVRGSGQPVPRVPADKLFDPDSPAAQPFALFVRQYGADDAASQQVLARIEAWKAAGSPSSSRMRIRAYPRDLDYRPNEAEVVLEKQWTKLVVEWPSSE